MMNYIKPNYLGLLASAVILILPVNYCRAADVEDLVKTTSTTSAETFVTEGRKLRVLGGVDRLGFARKNVMGARFRRALAL